MNHYYFSLCPLTEYPIFRVILGMMIVIIIRISPMNIPFWYKNYILIMLLVHCQTKCVWVTSSNLNEKLTARKRLILFSPAFFLICESLSDSMSISNSSCLLYLFRLSSHIGNYKTALHIFTHKISFPISKTRIGILYTCFNFFYKIIIS